jgi:diguanylate cyclase (GGDEF)-like protein
MNTNNVHYPPTNSRRHSVLVVLTSSVLTAAVLAFSVAFGLMSYNSSLDMARQQARLVSSLVSIQVNLLLQDVEERFEEISVFLETQKEAPDYVRHLHELLDSVQGSEPYVEGVQVEEPGGRIDAWSGKEGYHRPIGMSFSLIRSSEEETMRIGSPVRDPLHPGRWLFALSRTQIESGEGGFVVTILISLEPIHLVFGSMDVPQGTGVVVTDADGLVYMQNSESENIVGQRLQEVEGWHQDSVDGTPLMSRPGMVAGRSPVGQFPLLVTTTIPLDQAMETWRNHAYVYGGLSLVLILVSSGLSIALVRSQVQVNRQNRRLAMAAYTDMLTGALNRRAFMDAARREFSRVGRYGGGLTCVMIDLDNFKRINDMYGHAAGDLALVSTARFISTRIRETDLFCRYGGEEFVLLLPGTDLSGGRSMAESLRKGLGSLALQQEGRNFSITASFGVAEAASGVNTVEELLVCADQALYLAKTGGRNQVRIPSASCGDGASGA